MKIISLRITLEQLAEGLRQLSDEELEELDLLLLKANWRSGAKKSRVENSCT